MSKHEGSRSILGLMLQRYTIKERKEELQSTIRIKMRNFEQTRARDQELLSIMSELLSYMKRKNNALLNEIKLHGQVDGQLLRQILRGDKELLLALQSKTCIEARNSMSDKVCDMVKLLNRLTAVRYKNKEIVESLQKDFEYYQRFLTDTFDKNLATAVLNIESDVARIKKKHHTALMINKRYRAVHHTLAEESKKLPGYMDAILGALQSNRRELFDVMAIQKETLQMLDIYKKEMHQLENQTSDDHKRREESSSNMVRQIFQQQQEFERHIRKRKDQSETIISSETRKAIEQTKMEILAYTEKFETIKNGILVSDINTIIESFVNSGDVLSRLKTRKCDMEQRKRELCQMLDQLREQQAASQRHMQEMRDKFREQEARIRNQLEGQERRMDNLAELRKSSIILFIDAGKAVDSIHNKLLLATTGKTTQGNTAITVFKEDEGSVMSKLNEVKANDLMGKGMKLICHKMSECSDTLLSLMDVIANHSDGKNASSLLPCLLFHEEFERFSNPLPPAIIRLRLSNVNEDTHYDSGSNKVLTRDELKKKSIQFAEAKRKPGRS